MALYDAGDSMVSVSYLSKNVLAGSTESFNAGFKLPSNVTEYKAKAFVWDGTNITESNMIPVSNVTQITAP
ncbi:MAG: hypothetical protein AB1796_08605 [Bacillota bacterium]